MSTDPREQEEAEFALAARESGQKTRVRPILFTLVVTAVTLLAGFPLAVLFVPESAAERFGSIWFRVTMIAGAVSFVFFEWLAAKERRLLRQRPDLWGKRESR
jgi:uncharacterized membrane protein YbhN (UPF0104 family)